MIYNEKEFIAAVEQSFKAYKEKGARSTAKIKPIHKYIADILLKVFGSDYKVFYLGDKKKGDMSKEKQVMGKYYPKNIDITITNRDDHPVFCFGIKFVTANYKQNANNYFEGMIGETANIQALGNLPYAHVIILLQPTPYYNKIKIVTKSETIDDHDIKKYSELIFDNPQAHRPQAIAVLILKEKKGKFDFSDLTKDFSIGTIDILKTKLSIDNLFNEIKAYSSYLKTK